MSDTLTKDQEDTFSQRVQSHEARYPGYADKWWSLNKFLVSIGGRAVVPLPVPDLWTLERVPRLTIKRGTPIMIPGEPCSCHTNSAELMVNGLIDNICSGYGLSDDGLWRQHSWGLREDTIVETTNSRVVYVGVKLNLIESLGFVLNEGFGDLILKKMEDAKEHG